MDRKLYLIRRFYFESLNDEEYREFEEYTLTDEKFRRMIIRGAELKNMINEILGEKIEDDEEFKRIMREEEERASLQARDRGVGDYNEDEELDSALS